MGFGHTHENSVKSKPPANMKKIKNIYWDPDTEEFVFETRG